MLYKLFIEWVIAVKILEDISPSDTTRIVSVKFYEFEVFTVKKDIVPVNNRGLFVDRISVNPFLGKIPIGKIVLYIGIGENERHHFIHQGIHHFRCILQQSIGFFFQEKRHQGEAEWCGTINASLFKNIFLEIFPGFQRFFRVFNHPVHKFSILFVQFNQKTHCGKPPLFSVSASCLDEPQKITYYFSARVEEFIYTIYFNRPFPFRVDQCFHASPVYIHQK